MTEYWRIKTSSRCGMQIGEICNAVAFGLPDWKGLFACLQGECHFVWQSLCNMLQRTHPLIRKFPHSFFGITEMIGPKHSKFLSGRCYESIKKKSLPFTYYTAASQKWCSAFPHAKHNSRDKKYCGVCESALQALCLHGLGWVSLGPGNCLHPACSALPVLPHRLSFPTMLLGSVEILSPSSVRRPVYLTLKFSYQLHRPAVAARPKLFSIVRELNGARPAGSTGLEALILGRPRWKCCR